MFAGKKKYRNLEYLFFKKQNQRKSLRDSLLKTENLSMVILDIFFSPEDLESMNKMSQN